MFYGRFVDELGGDWATVARDLLAPPALGRYLPFADYPNVDHFRLAVTCARRRFPALGSRESIRRVAREDMATFLRSTLGRITAAMLITPASALGALPSVYDRISKGLRYTSEPSGPRAARIKVRGSHGPWEYVVGQLEGILGHYETEPSIVCSLENDEHGNPVRCFEVSF